MDRHDMSFAGQTSDMGLGAIQVSTTVNRGHPVDFWIDDVMRNLVHVADTAPPPIRDQAHAFQDALRREVTRGMHAAVQSHHTTLLYHLNRAGMREAAALIQTIRS
jgi:hypothetical protein